MNDPRFKRLGIGTVQFGLDYAIDTSEVRPSEKQTANILDAAAAAGIDVLDTASAYGDAEELLGRILSDTRHFRIVTKTPAFTGSRMTHDQGDALVDGYRKSLNRLGVASAYGLLIHRAEDILVEGGEYLFDAMQRLKQDGEVQKIGVSVYTADQIDRAIARYPINIIQVPASILDQRLIADGRLGALKREGVEIHARSVFLKGIIFTDPQALPPHFDPAKPALAALRAAAKDAGTELTTAALGFVLDVDEIDTALFGVTNLQQLNAILQGLQNSPGTALPDPERFAITDPDILNPARWPDFEAATT